MRKSNTCIRYLTSVKDIVQSSPLNFPEFLHLLAKNLNITQVEAMMGRDIAMFAMKPSQVPQLPQVYDCS